MSTRQNKAIDCGLSDQKLVKEINQLMKNDQRRNVDRAFNGASNFADSFLDLIHRCTFRPTMSVDDPQMDLFDTGRFKYRQNAKRKCSITKSIDMDEQVKSKKSVGGDNCSKHPKSNLTTKKNSNETPSSSVISATGLNSKIGEKCPREFSKSPYDDSPWCPQCRKSFASNASIKRHYLQVHTGVQPFQCPFCGKRFSLKANMQRHCHTHVGMPYLK